MDKFIEKLTKQSEFGIRKQNMNKMLKEDYSSKLKHTQAVIEEFIDILGKDNVTVLTSGGG